jgi:hypothetical protein
MPNPSPTSLPETIHKFSFVRFFDIKHGLARGVNPFCQVAPGLLLRGYSGAGLTFRLEELTEIPTVSCETVFWGEMLFGREQTVFCHSSVEGDPTNSQIARCKCTIPIRLFQRID